MVDWAKELGERRVREARDAEERERLSQDRARTDADMFRRLFPSAVEVFTREIVASVEQFADASRIPVRAEVVPSGGVDIRKDHFPAGVAKIRFSEQERLAVMITMYRPRRDTPEPAVPESREMAQMVVRDGELLYELTGHVAMKSSQLVRQWLTSFFARI